MYTLLRRGYLGAFKKPFAEFTAVRSVSSPGEAISSNEESKISELESLKEIDARTGEPRAGRSFNYKMELTTLAKRLGYELNTLPSLQTALTHRSANWTGAPHEHNGRLAVLGKGVLIHYLQEYLYFTYPNMDARSIWDISEELTHQDTLSDLNNQLGITELLLTKVKPDDSRYKNMLGKTLTAVLGALYCDQGTLAVRETVHQFILPIIKSGDMRDYIKLRRPVQTLNEILKRQGKPKAEVRVLKETGRLSHFPTFVMGVYSGEHFLAEGAGTSLSRAKHEAMAAAIRQLYMRELKNVSLPSDRAVEHNVE